MRACARQLVSGSGDVGCHPASLACNLASLIQACALPCPTLQAFAEWVPVRGLDPASPDLAGCHRNLHFGDLMTLVGGGLAAVCMVVCCEMPGWGGWRPGAAIARRAAPCMHS